MGVLRHGIDGHMREVQNEEDSLPNGTVLIVRQVSSSLEYFETGTRQLWRLNFTKPRAHLLNPNQGLLASVSAPRPPV